MRGEYGSPFDLVLSTQNFAAVDEISAASPLALGLRNLSAGLGYHLQTDIRSARDISPSRFPTKRRVGRGSPQEIVSHKLWAMVARSETCSSETWDVEPPLLS